MNEIPLFTVHMPHAIDAPLLEVLHSGYIGQGKKVDQFEKELAKYLDNENILTLNSGTSAIELALHLSGAKPGKSVVSTPMTCSATNTAILSRGAEIIWADINPKTGLIDPMDAIRKLRKDTVAIIGVDWGGQSCAWSALMGAGTAYGVSVIEDAAHALGGRYGRRRAGGGQVDFTCFSLQAIKSITTVDGGILTCKKTSDYTRGKLLRWYGIDRETPRQDMRCEEDIAEAGWKWHMNDVNATIGLVQLQYLEGVVNAQRENALYYYRNLEGPISAFDSEAITESPFWLYTILCENKDQRLRFMDWMKQRKVMVSQVHARCDKHTCFEAAKAGPLPGVDEFTEKQISIPVHWKLTETEREYVCESVNMFFTRERANATIES